MKQIGDYGEICFLKEAQARGYDISIPFGDNTSYDFILDNGSQLFRVQVKTTATLTDKGASYKFLTARGANSKKAYTREDVDVIVCIVIPQEIFYILPISYIENKVTIRVYPDNEQSKNNPYKENWELFEKTLEEVSF